MKFDIDTYREILDTLTRNKTRSFLTGFGVFWGVFMLVVLIGGGDGLEELLSKNFQGFATNSAFTFAQPTTKPYEGFRKGRQWNMTYRDVERLRAHVPELDIVTPLVTEWGKTFVAGDKKFVGNVKGIYPEYAKVEEPTILYGRYLNDMDIAGDRKVCVIGKKVYKTLFPNGGDPCGQLVRVDSLYFNVVGVDYSPGNMNIN
ncbi:ABC transporter permease, partial [Hallella bergensis]|uniref:ABC transporter permease n=1 Tax=Hallella bergensis TaxID=242750 RepID=UPI0023F0C69B